MAANGNAPPAAAQPPAEEAGEGLWGFISSLPRYIFLFWTLQSVVGMIMKQMGSLPDSTGNSTTSELNATKPADPVAALLWPVGVWTQLQIFLSEDEFYDPWDPNRSTKPWKVMDERMLFGNDSEFRKVETVVPLSDAVQTNGSLWAHVYYFRHPASPNPRSPSFDKKAVVRLKKLLTRYQLKRRAHKLKKLMGSKVEEVVATDTDTPESSTAEDQIISYWNSNLTFAVVHENAGLIRSALPPAIQKHIHLTEDSHHYYPIFWDHDFWVLSDHLVEINTTTKELPLRIEFYPLSLWKFQLYQQMDESFRMQETMFGQSSRDTEEFKRMLVEANPVLLGITFVVSLLHSVFDFLAFKNDIQFWRKKKSLEGLSTRTIVTNVLFQSIILLYLFDNETSWMILISSTIGLVIECWKVTRAVDFKVTWNGPLPQISISSKQTSKAVKKTEKYDQIAFKYLSIAIIPLLIGYTIYSVFYLEHKSWWSFILGTLVGFVYAFGFVSMTPQLYINYKLKSVAHMPLRTLTYKALNTFIDDLFSFIIKMPFLHRIACFRDDIVFFIYLYQYYKYPVDHRRRNEFGQVGEGGGEDEDGEDDDEIDARLLEEKEKAEKENTSKAVVEPATESGAGEIAKAGKEDEARDNAVATDGEGLRRRK